MEDKTSIASRVEQDHREINRQMAQLQASMKSDVRSEDFSGWKLEFIWQLRDFKNRLLKHFDLEEEGGFMRDVLDAAPQFELKVNQLRDDHDRIAVGLDRLTSQLKRMQKIDPSRIERIRAGLAGIMTDLREHENEEHILIQRAYYREFGGGD